MALYEKKPDTYTDQVLKEFIAEKQDLFNFNYLETIFIKLRENNFNNADFSGKLSDLLIHWLNIIDSEKIKNALNWFVSELNDIERQTEKDKDGNEYTPNGKKLEREKLEIKKFGVKINDFKRTFERNKINQSI